MNEIIQCDLLNHFSSIKQGFLTKQASPQEVFSPFTVCRTKQVHGNALFHLKDIKDIERYKHTKADIMITDVARAALAISTADCVPILFYDPKKNVIAASHAGWKGAAKNVSETTVRALQTTFGCKTENLIAAIGPAIQMCCFEVDAPVYNVFFYKDFFKINSKRKGHWMFDLPQLNRYQLIQAGLLDKNIWVSSLCTSCRIDLFCSYRKEGKNCGRQYSFIALSS